MRVTQLLERMASGDEVARSRVWEYLYDQLKACARRAESSGGGEAGLQATELIGIAFARMGELEGKEWADRNHFISVAALAMRTAIIDRVRGPERRRQPSPLDFVVEEVRARVDGDLLGFYDELDAFARIDRVMAHALELKALGYSSAETAALVGLTPRTFSRRFERARAHMRGRLQWMRDSGDE